jgi:hypothetical protein
MLRTSTSSSAGTAASPERQNPGGRRRVPAASACHGAGPRCTGPGETDRCEGPPQFACEHEPGRARAHDNDIRIEAVRLPSSGRRFLQYSDGVLRDECLRLHGSTISSSPLPVLQVVIRWSTGKFAMAPGVNSRRHRACADQVSVETHCPVDRDFAHHQTRRGRRRGPVPFRIVPGTFGNPLRVVGHCGGALKGDPVRTRRLADRDAAARTGQ